jgi:hypothetical protein
MNIGAVAASERRKRIERFNKFCGRVLGIRHEIAARFWTAVAERSGDTALGRTGEFQLIRDGRAHENGVALRFPLQSKMLARGPIVLNHGGHSFSQTALSFLQNKLKAEKLKLEMACIVYMYITTLFTCVAGRLGLGSVSSLT